MARRYILQLRRSWIMTPNNTHNSWYVVILWPAANKYGRHVVTSSLLVAGVTSREMTRVQNGGYHRTGKNTVHYYHPSRLCVKTRAAFIRSVYTILYFSHSFVRSQLVCRYQSNIPTACYRVVISNKYGRVWLARYLFLLHPFCYTDSLLFCIKKENFQRQCFTHKPHAYFN